MNKNHPYIIFLMGPTGIGKTQFAKDISENQPIEIINVDTGMIYKDMNIGTNKPTLDDQIKIRHSLIDIISPDEFYSIGNFILDINININRIMKKNKVPVLVGGSILYFNVLYNGLISLPSKNTLIRNNISKAINYIGNKNICKIIEVLNSYSFNKYELDNKKKLERIVEIYFLTRKFFYLDNKNIKLCSQYISNYNIIPISIKSSKRFFLNKNIRIRFMEMIEKGLIKEVEYILNKYKLNKNSESMKCIGYKQVYSYITGDKKENSYKNMINEVVLSTRKLVKKQSTWIKKWNNLIELDLEEYKKNDILDKINKYFKV